MAKVWRCYNNVNSTNYREWRLLVSAIRVAIGYAMIYLEHTLSVLTRGEWDPWLSSILTCIFGSATEATRYYVKRECKLPILCFDLIKIFCR